MTLGWKTITGAFLIGLGYACKAVSSINPILDTAGDALIAIGFPLMGVGGRVAIAKIGNGK
jgi:hypothetical protein